MASYTITLTDGTIFAVVDANTLNQTSSVTLIGENYVEYGSYADENWIHLLENSSSSTAPASPLTGQLWYDSGNTLPKIWNGTSWDNMILQNGSNISVGNITASGNATISGNESIGGNLTVGGTTSLAGNIISSVNIDGNEALGGNLTVAGTISAVGNIRTSGNLYVSGNAVIAGTVTTIGYSNIVVDAKTITVANSVSTSALIDGAGLNAGTPTVAYIHYNDAANAWTTANGFSCGGNLTVTGTSALTGVVTAPTAANGTSNTQVATTAFVANNSIPPGGIIMWSGTIVSVPTGWYLCDGSNGTPDLRNRFIVGAGSTYSVGGTGGSADATLVSHSHTASTSITDPGHIHSTGAAALGGGGAWYNTGGSGVVYQTGSAVTGITASTSVSTSGSSPTNANLPPYYALAFIMKA